MSGAPWDAVEAALGKTAAAGGITRFWLRDDDAVTVTPALERLGALTAAAGIPLLLAVVPANATAALAGWVAERPHVTPCQHGWAHVNHAAAAERACELGGERGDEAVVDELSAGRAAMRRLFGDGAPLILVPPWNRIRDSLVPRLPGLGFAALSAFASARRDHDPPIPRIDCDLDIIDWRNGRRGRTVEDLCARLAALIEAARPQTAPIGVLTHHLAHDGAAWSFLDAFLDRIARNPHATFISAALLPPCGEGGTPQA